MTTKATKDTGDDASKVFDNPEPDDLDPGIGGPDLPRNPFAALKVSKADRTVLAGSATTIDPQVIDFVESLKAAYDDEPDFWYPVKMDTSEDLARALDQARTYASTRKEGKLTVSRRVDQDDKLLWWFRVAPYVPRSQR